MEKKYAQALGESQWKVFSRKLTWCFLHATSWGPPRQCSIEYEDPARGQVVVSVPANADDIFWSMDLPTREERLAFIKQGIDRVVSPDGRTGRIRELIETPAIPSSSSRTGNRYTHRAPAWAWMGSPRWPSGFKESSAAISNGSHARSWPAATSPPPGPAPSADRATKDENADNVPGSPIEWLSPACGGQGTSPTDNSGCSPVFLT